MEVFRIAVYEEILNTSRNIDIKLQNQNLMLKLMDKFIAHVNATSNESQENDKARE